MINIISDTYGEFSLHLTNDIIAAGADHFILKNFSSLLDNFLQARGDPQLLKAELGQLFSSPTSFSVDTLAFVDEWSYELHPSLDLAQLKYYRELLYRLYYEFENSDAINQISHRFQLSKEELLTTASSSLVLDWVTLWSMHIYPNIALLTLGQKHIRPFIATQSFALDQFICYLPTLVLWKIRTYLHSSKTRQLTLELAYGQNVRSSPSCPFAFSRKMAHLFINSPIELSFDDAVWRAIVLGWGGNEWLAKQLKTYFGQKSKQPDFIRLLVFFFRKHEEESSTSEMKHLLGYLQHRWDENEGEIFNLKGWTLTSLQRKAMQWYENIRQQQQAQYPPVLNLAPSWQGASYQPFELEKDGSLYQIIQLNSIKKLAEEGRRMMHCVGNYASYCQLRGSSIWSLRQTKGDRHRSLVTIEITRDHRIVQARKMFNANPDKYDLEIIQQWAKAEKLAFQ